VPAGAAPGGWSLKRDAEGIKIYTRSLTDASSNVKALRVTLTTAGTPAALAKILLDIPGQKNWVYSTKSSRVLKKVSESEVIYHSEKTMPWPVTNRDAVMHLRIATAANGVMNVRAATTDYPYAKKDDVIRVPSSTVVWRVTPTSPTEIKIEYEATLDPGGSVPAWVTNLFITKGPYETFKKLKTMLAESGDTREL
jgi:hypothetical protein